MYSYLFFGLVMVGIFSIIENLKGGPKYSSVKINILLLLLFITVSSILDFLNEFGYNIILFRSIIGFTAFLTFMNLLFFISIQKIPKALIVLEIIIYPFFIITYLYGYRSAMIINGELINELGILEKIKFLIKAAFFSITMFYNLFFIFKSSNNNNLYRVKIKRWSIFLILMLFFTLLIQVLGVLLYYKKVSSHLFDSRFVLFMVRLILLLFIAYRPKYLDDSVTNLKINELFVKPNAISFDDFEFLFYTNQYYLNLDANLDDFALKLNRSKEEVLAFFKIQLDQNFTELLNQNRVEYLKQLLRSKKYESFTIEALSEMSGFGTRRSMYNYFNKYVGMTPSDFINSIK